jgi:hypothetical protein
MSKLQGHDAAGGLGKLKKKINDLIRTATRDLPACRIATQPSKLPLAKQYIPPKCNVGDVISDYTASHTGR